MARSTSYLAPWAPGYNKQELREQLNQRYKKSTKKMLKEAGMDYSMSRGYYYTEDDDWGPKPKQPPEKVIRLATGRKVKVYDNDLGGGVEYNNAINATLSRTFNTSASIIVVLFVMFLFGGESIRGFIFAMLLGILVGTYSSLFLATPILVDSVGNKPLYKKKEKEGEEGLLENDVLV